MGPIDYLFSLEQYGIKLGLDNIAALCEGLDHPEQAFTPILVAGTNGKGSVAAMLDTALRSSGYATGRFTSPHLVHLEERFAVNGRAVSQDTLAREAQRLRTTIQRLQAIGKLERAPTFFEATTAIAFSLFRQSGAHVGVLEVGMGGRFDATNIVNPAAAVITSIDLDHQRYLGSTLEEIAFEKAGVIRRGILVVSNESKPAAFEVFRDICSELEARLVDAGEEVDARVELRDGRTELEMTTPIRRYGPVLMSLRGRHQVRNAIAAVRLLEELRSIGVPVTAPAILDALTETRWPGRLDLVRVDDRRAVLLDAAHNAAAAATLAAYLREVHPAGVPLVFGAARDKDAAGMLRALDGAVTRVICVPLRTHRALTADELADVVKTTSPELPVAIADSAPDALETAWADGDMACAAGSIYLIGELVPHLSRL